MNSKKEILSVLFFTVLFTFLFHRQDLGINLLIFETALLTWLIFTKQFSFSNKYSITCGAGLILTALATVLSYSTFSFTINFMTLIAFTGVMIYPGVKSLINSLRLSLSNLYRSQIRFAKELFEIRYKGHRPGNYIWESRIFFVPTIIIFLFVLMYSKSNPVFDGFVSRAGIFINEYIINFLEIFDGLIPVTFFIGLLISVFFLVRVTDAQIIKSDVDSEEELQRVRKKNKRSLHAIGLKREYKAAVFLLFALNAILLVLNIIDINWVWFNFEWSGQYLKQFVHEGTYLLLLSIFISIALVLYFFRGSLNFFSKNKLLRYLSYTWLIQNAILTVSVAIRNFRYIDFFSLAYKRIWVIVFLALVLYGLYTVFNKVRNRRSAFYLFRTNTYAAMVVLIICSVFNWDNIIAKYNFNHSGKSFLHLDYLATLSDQSLPYLDKPLEELIRIDQVQKQKFPFGEKYMSPEEYCRVIEERKEFFRQKWESKNFLSWNLPEYLAYKKLFGSNDIRTAATSPQLSELVVKAECK